MSVLKTILPFSRKDSIFTFWLVLLFFFVSLIGILNHEVWLDEIQAWLIARDSTSIVDLFRNLRYEGHPGLWHLNLYFISRITHNPTAMQLFHLIIATINIYVFVKFSPFNKLHKVLFTFSYFPFYEYSIISRNYNLGILFIFLFCKFFPTRKKSYFILASLLSILANTNVYSFIISICLFLTLIVDFISNSYFLENFRYRIKNILISFAILLFGYAVALLQIIPPADAKFTGSTQNFGESNNLINTIKHLSYVLMTVWRSYVPLPNFLEDHFWNTNLLIEGAGSLRVIALFFSLILLIFSIVIFIRKPIVLFLYTSGTFGILLFTYTKFSGYLRHHGHLFILLIACLWLTSYYPRRYTQRGLPKFTHFFTKYKYQILTTILYVHVLASVFAFSMDLIHPFSASKEVAQFIKSQQLDNKLIVGSKDYAVAPISALLDRQLFYLESNNLGSFISWNQREDLNETEFIQRLHSVVTQNNTPILLILNYALYDQAYKMFNISPLFQSSQSIVHGENYYLYSLTNKHTALKK
ncbi:hypothetical protein [Chroococcidiopsis sp. TS-821]|uniref:hypothetical protein n=1 Tax=Chroococcidiopsis sp. TS-821 TaxID=1378066 RepID=UPI000CEF0425|nr:hypothetical protein [Chroococcidiopsis sp. TS-821]PPS45652.1 hypothetical protein B1A85_05255 [Chroococcidiopsis sp. TS-821]